MCDPDGGICVNTESECVEYVPSAFRCLCKDNYVALVDEGTQQEFCGQWYFYVHVFGISL